MSFVDPLHQPRTFARQAQELVRASFAAPVGSAGPDPFAVIDAHLDASFERALADAMRPSAEGGASMAAAASVRTAPTTWAHAGPPGTSPATPSAGEPQAGPVALSGQPLPPTAWNYGTPAAIASHWPVASMAGPSGMAALGGVDGVGRVDSASDASSMASSGAHWESALTAAARRYEVPDWLVRSVVKAESGGNPQATSSVGAMGLMQLMPATAREMGVQNAYDPAQNLDGGVRYLRCMLDRFDGDFTKAVAAYNAGPATVAHYGGVPPFAETRQYVQRVLGTTASFMTGDEPPSL